LLAIDAKSPLEVINALSRAVSSAPGVRVSADVIATEAQARDEGGGSMQHAEGFVALHARVQDVDAIRIALATVRTPMAWTDGREVKIIVLAVAPRERPVQSLRLFAQLERLLDDPAARAWIEQSTNPEALAPWFDARVREEDGPLTARDVMRPALGKYRPTMTVPQLTQTMARTGMDAVGITNEDRHMVGVVTANDLFTLGLPDFLRQLESVSFLADLDPFEKYFAREQHLTARDVMRSDYAALPPDATILEVVFQLAVKDQPKVFVVRDKELVGVIDRIRVIDRILEL
jgi:CBS domain-containing protein/mannitol/fructose-specific phosphotransferase system IIA component (Ntr-type)